MYVFLETLEDIVLYTIAITTLPRLPFWDRWPQGLSRTTLASER